MRVEAAARGFSVFDATCPLVNKVHIEVAKLAREGYEFIMIGHKGHPEVEGTMGQLDHGIYLVEDVDDVAQVEIPPGQKLAVVTQTTLSVDDAAAILAAVKRRFPDVREPKQQDICYATQNRQDAVKMLAPGVDVLVVVGSPSSSNSNRLRELAERLGAAAYMVDAADDLKPEWFEGRRRVGVTAGASAPELLVQKVVDRLRDARRGLGAQPAGRGRDGAFPAAQGPGRQGDGHAARQLSSLREPQWGPQRGNFMQIPAKRRSPHSARPRARLSPCDAGERPAARLARAGVAPSAERRHCDRSRRSRSRSPLRRGAAGSARRTRAAAASAG